MLELNQRRSPRLASPMPIRVFGRDVAGNDFFEDSSALVVSQQGARIFLTQTPDPDEELLILCHQTDQGGSFRVVGNRGGWNGHKSWAVECVRAPWSIWGIEFPPPGPDDQGRVRVMLVCTECQTGERLFLEESEVESIAQDGGLRRGCNVCQMPRLWAVVPYLEEPCFAVAER